MMNTIAYLIILWSDHFLQLAICKHMYHGFENSTVMIFLRHI